MEKLYSTKEERATIPIGSIIHDREDGDCWFEGIWLGEDKYKCTSVFWNGELYKTTEEDDTIGQIISPRWYYIKIKE
jgi:hypothetical protein